MGIDRWLSGVTAGARRSRAHDDRGGENDAVPAPFRSDRSWQFGVPREALWEHINATAEYPSWWPWLREFDCSGPIVEGGRWSCAVVPPLSYTVRFTIEFGRVEVGRVVDAVITGDIEGTARLTIESRSDGSNARLVSSLRPSNPLLRGFATVARPLVGYGHDWILDEGRRQFVERAFGDG